MMFENILLIIILVMMIYVIFIFMNWIKDIVEIIFKIVSIPKKPKIHIFNSSLEDSDIDPFKEFSDFDGDGCYDHLDSDAEDPNITHLTNCSVDVPMITSKGLIFLMIILSLLSYLQIQYSNLYKI